MKVLKSILSIALIIFSNYSYEQGQIIDLSTISTNAPGQLDPNWQVQTPNSNNWTSASISDGSWGNNNTPYLGIKPLWGYVDYFVFNKYKFCSICTNWYL